jgi:hypothetical protein
VTPTSTQTATPELTPTVTPTNTPTLSLTPEFTINWVDNQDYSKVNEFTHIQSADLPHIVEYARDQNKLRTVPNNVRQLGIGWTYAAEPGNGGYVIIIDRHTPEYAAIVRSGHPETIPWQTLQGFYVEDRQEYLLLVQFANADGSDTLFYVGVPKKAYENDSLFPMIFTRIGSSIIYPCPMFNINDNISKSNHDKWIPDWIKTNGYDPNTVDDQMTKLLSNYSHPVFPDELEGVVLPLGGMSY